MARHVAPNSSSDATGQLVLALHVALHCHSASLVQYCSELLPYKLYISARPAEIVVSTKELGTQANLVHEHVITPFTGTLARSEHQLGQLLISA